MTFLLSPYVQIFELAVCVIATPFLILGLVMVVAMTREGE
jgi:hypothetical protein